MSALDKHTAESFASYHRAHARFGGASYEFHARAETWILAALAEIERRGEVEKLDRKIVQDQKGRIAELEREVERLLEAEALACDERDQKDAFLAAAEAHVAELEREVERMKERVADRSHVVSALCVQSKRVAELEQALREYGSHAIHCAIFRCRPRTARSSGPPMTDPCPCDCGLDAAQADKREEPEPLNDGDNDGM